MTNPFRKAAGAASRRGGQYTTAFDPEAIAAIIAARDAAMEKPDNAGDVPIPPSLEDITRVFKLDENNTPPGPFVVDPDDENLSKLSQLQVAAVDGIASAVTIFAAEYPAATKAMQDGKMTIGLKKSMQEAYEESSATGQTMISMGGNKPTLVQFAIGRGAIMDLINEKNMRDYNINGPRSPVEVPAMNALKAGPDVKKAISLWYQSVAFHEFSHAMDGTTRKAASAMLLSQLQANTGKSFGKNGPGPFGTWVKARLSKYAGSAPTPDHFQAETFAEVMTAALNGSRLPREAVSFVAQTKAAWKGQQYVAAPVAASGGP